MSNPLTPLFPVELEKEKIESLDGSDNFVVDKEVENDVDDILKAEIPKETTPNHVLVGGVGMNKDYSYSFYNPHNARYYYDFDQWNFKPKLKEGVGRGRFRLGNKNSEWILDEDFFGCRFVVKKKVIEVTNKVDKNRLFKIFGNADNRRLLIAEANATLERECIHALREFVKEFGGSTSFRCGKPYIPDNKIYHDKVIDTLPSKMSFRNDVVKKVYLEEPNNVEYSDPSYVANYFRNQGVRDYGEEILSELSVLKNERLEFNKALALYTEQINLHLKVEENQLRVQDETLKTLRAIRESNDRNSKVFDVLELINSEKGSDRQRRVRDLLKEYGW